MRVCVHDGMFEVSSPIQLQWTHVVLNFKGNGIWLFLDGIEKEGTTSKDQGTYSPGDGRIFVGKRYTDLNGSYVSMDVDEVIYFNKALSDEEISDLHMSV